MQGWKRCLLTCGTFVAVAVPRAMVVVRVFAKVWKFVAVGGVRGVVVERVYTKVWRVVRCGCFPRSGRGRDSAPA